MLQSNKNKIQAIMTDSLERIIHCIMINNQKMITYNNTKDSFYQQRHYCNKCDEYRNQMVDAWNFNNCSYCWNSDSYIENLDLCNICNDQCNFITYCGEYEFKLCNNHYDDLFDIANILNKKYILMMNLFDIHDISHYIMNLLIHVYQL